jgi:uncharacterized protein (DUF1330 family)
VIKASSETQRYYQVVFIWMKDPTKFRHYLELMSPIVQRYGGGLERMLSPEVIYAEGIAKPDTINVVFYDSRDAFVAFTQDPELQKIVHLRSESIDMVAIGGLPIRGQVTDERLDERIYAVEMARFGSSGAAGYRAYEEQAGPIMQRYGYHVERVLAPDAVSGLPFTPDIVKVAYFDSPDGMDRVRRDPAHHRIESELYPSAVERSVWVIAKVHPSMIR